MMKRFKSLIAASALALTALVSGAQILSTNPPQHVFISDTTLMWSCQDPFAFGQVSNLLALAAAQDSSNAVFSAALGSLSQGGSSLSAAFTVHTGAYAAASAAQASSNALLASAVSAASNALDARITASTNALGAALSAADLSLGARITAGTNAVWGWAYDADTLLRGGILAASNTALMAWTASTNAQGVVASAASSAAAAVISATDSFNAAAQASSNAAYSAAASTGAVGIAGNAVAIASSAAADAAAAIGLASTYFAYSTSAVAVASAAALDASNAVAVANAIRAQNEYPSSLWTPSVTVPQDTGVFGWLDLTSGGAPTATVHHVVWPTNAHWYTAGAAVLTNALTSDTNALVTAYFPTNAVVRQAPDGSLPFPLPVITGASDSWEWDQAMGVFGVTNRFILTAVTDAGGSVSVYLGMTNVYSGYLYASTNLSEAAYTGLVSVAMQPAVLGVTGTVTLFRARDPATTNASALASANSLGLVSDALEQEALERAQEDAAIRGEIIAATGAIPASAVSPSQVTNIAEFVSGVAATSLSNLVTAGSGTATNLVTRWHADATNWLVYSGSNIVTLYSVGITNVPGLNINFNGTGQGPFDIGPFPFSASGYNSFITDDGAVVEIEAVVSVWTTTNTPGVYPAELINYGYPETIFTVFPVTNSVVVTNSSTYYLQNTVVPPETWSYASQTNWMADGNAGQMWVTSLSYDSANGVMNTHLHPSGTAHDSRYVKMDSGVATNLTIEGTLSGTVDATGASYVRVPTPVSGNDAATVTWVRGLLNSGAFYYNTTQYIDTAFATNTYLYATNNPAALVPKTFAIVSNGQYVSSIATPDYVTLPHGPATISIWMEKTGLPSSSLSIRPELYFSYDRTNILYEAQDVTAQAVTPGMNLYQWVISFPDQPSSYVIRRLKVTAVTGSPSLTVYGGNGFPSTLAITSLGSGEDSLGARGATNLTVNGVAQSYDANTRTLMATVAGGSATIFSAVTNLPLVASGATNRVTLYSDRSVYVVTATNLVNAITNVGDNLTLTGKKADWELWVNFTNPAGTNMLWCTCMQFDAVPEITVTGLYKYACSTVDGLTVQARQIYPTPGLWEQVASTETANAALGYGFYTVMADSATNDYLYLLSDDTTRPLWLRIAIGTSSVAVRTNAVEIIPGLLISGVVEQWTNTVAATICNANISYSFASFVLPPLDSLCFGGSSIYVGNLSNRYSLWFNRKAPGTGVVTSRAILGRRLNELEIKAYNAGWRP